MTYTADQKLERDVLNYALPAALVGRLRREQGWNAEYTERVLAEYRCFVLLAALNERRVTPS